MDRSNLMMFNPGSGKGDRVGIKTLKDNTKVRYFKSNGEVVDL
jgi:large subunit ribosomal protein L24